MPVDLNELRRLSVPQGRPLILHHWATWCDPCAEELPLVERLFQQLDGAADVVGISWDLLDPQGPPGAVAAAVAGFAAQAGVTWPTLLFIGSPDELFTGLELSFQRIPQTRVIDATGRLVRQIDGPMSEEDVRGLVAQLQGTGS